MRFVRFAPLAAVAVAGCTLIYDPDDVEPPPSRAEVQAFVEAWLDAYLASGVACTGATTAWVETWQLRDREAYAEVLMDLWDRGVRRFDRGQAASCLTVTAAPASCDALIDTQYPPPDHACALALRGARGLGEVCGAHGECGPSLFCDGSAGVCPGTCRPRGQLGSLCSSGATVCERNLACTYQFSSGNMYCRGRHLEEGAACGDGEGICAFGLNCGGSGLCERPSGLGEGCDGYPCADWLTCDPGTLLCVDRIPVGQGCTVGNWSCVLGARCNGSGLCEPNAGPGEACGDLADGGEGQDCTGGLCIDPTCVPFPVRGEPSASLPCAPVGLGIGNVGGVCGDYCT